MIELCVHGFWHNSTFASVIGSAIGSTLGSGIIVVLFFVIRYRYRREKEIVYYLGESTQREDGKLIVMQGNIVDDSLQVKSSSLIFDKEGNIFHGPYNTDLYHEGKFRVRFQISGEGFKENVETETKRTVILKLDVCHTIFYNQKADQNLYGVRYIKYEDFLGRGDKNIIDFDVIVFSKGVGLWEYRTFLSSKISNLSKSLNEKNTPFNIYFHRVVVSYIPEVDLR